MVGHMPPITGKVATFVNGIESIGFHCFNTRPQGACRNLINDRLELTGMNWTTNGAEIVMRFVLPELLQMLRYPQPLDNGVAADAHDNQHAP